jgi:hypothetical protein
VRLFDRKFGPAFLAGVPAEPGVYRLYDEAGRLLYVGKAKCLRRRLAQYRVTRRLKKDRKRQALVRAAVRIDWEVRPSELDAGLEEIRLIQDLQPRENVAGAFPFLYPFVGLAVEGRETRFCLTTTAEAFSRYELHGAFRSRRVTRTAFFSLMRLLAFVAHPSPQHRRERRALPRYSCVRAFRHLPAGWPDLWRRFLRGESRAALEALALRLLEHAAARARRSEVQEALREVARFFDEEAVVLRAALQAAGAVEAAYPVPQRERDALLLRYRAEAASIR